MQLSFFALPTDKPDLPANERTIYRLLMAALMYIPTMQILNGLGILSIYALGVFGVFDKNEPLLVLVALICLVDAALHAPLYALLRENKIEATIVWLLLINGSLSVAQTALWQNIPWFPIGLVASPVIVFFLQKGFNLRSRLFVLFFGLSATAATFYIDSAVTMPRLQLQYIINLSALAVYILFVISMVIFVILASLVEFQTIQTRLIWAFTIAALLSTIVTLLLGSMSSFLKSRQDAFSQMEIISNLKIAELQTYLTQVNNQAKIPTEDNVIAQRIRYMLGADSQDISYQINLDLVRASLGNIQLSPADEMLIVRADGRTILATNRTTERQVFTNAPFLQDAQNKVAFRIEKNFAAINNQYSLLALNPIFSGEEFLGVIVFRTNIDTIRSLVSKQAKAGTSQESYLVSQTQAASITDTQGGAINDIRSLPLANILQQETNKNIYPNYQGEIVQGYHVDVPELQATLVTEMEQQEVVAGITNSLIVNLSVGGLSVLLVFFIVFTTAQTISRPIVELAQNATSLAGGELAVRAQMNRKDEIGTLANSFNAMAAELQTLVRTLEEQVTERTQAFEKQTNYLRVASEVARDSANAKNLDDLLNQASALVMNRFGFYHTGIFLLDDDQEYAILRASPTEAGQEMLRRRHKLKVGQVGIVGYAAATGVPRIALDTGKDVAYFNNPLLPQTRSEAAIPLKANEKTIGILDVQSTEPDAFTPDDISTLQIMADQLALAIERVQLLETMQQNYEELQNAYQRFTRESWQGFELDEDFKPGYHYDGVKITPLETYPLPTRSLLQRGRAVILPQRDSAKETQVAAPIKLREQVIGVLAITFASEEVTKDVLEMIEETANRLAVSLENARLYTETQKLVERERAVSEISSQITTSFNIENILRTAVMEIGRLAPDAEVSVQLEQEKRA